MKRLSLEDAAADAEAGGDDGDGFAAGLAGPDDVELVGVDGDWSSTATLEWIFNYPPRRVDDRPGGGPVSAGRGSQHA